MRFNRLLPLLIPLLTLIFLEIFFFNPKMIYVVLVLANLSIFFAVWQFSRAGCISKERWNFLILPTLMLIAVTVYSTLLSNKFFVHILFILNTILLYIYLRYIYYYLVRPISYEAFSIEHISSYGNFLTFFLVSAAIYGLQSFLNIPIWLLMIIILVVASLIVYQVIWANKIDLRKGLIFILISSLILLELFWSISFLPINHNVAGLTMAICYYMLIGLVRHFLIDKLDKRKIKLYLGFGMASLFIILLTARWL